MSRVGQLRKAYTEQGEQAAIEVGRSLGLAEATIKTQLGRIKRPASSTPRQVEHEPPATPPPPPKNRLRPVKGVFCRGDLIRMAERAGIITHPGDQQSEVRWDDSGHSQFVCNSWIRHATWEEQHDNHYHAPIKQLGRVVEPAQGRK